MSNYQNQLFRAWCIDYSLRTPRADNPTAAQILADAKEYAAFIAGSQPATVINLVKTGEQQP